MTKLTVRLPGMIHKNATTATITGLVSLVLLALIPGCGKEQAQYVEVEATEKPVAVEDHSGHAHTMPEQQAGAPLNYELPEGWTVKSPRPMQLVTIDAGEGATPANFSVSAFPGDVGGQVANVNRWRRQLGLGPVSSEVAMDLISPVTIAGVEGWKVDMTGNAPEMDDHGAARMVVSAVSHGGQTWFFKLVGAQSTVEPELEHYKAFIESISF